MTDLTPQQLGMFSEETQQKIKNLQLTLQEFLVFSVQELQAFELSIKDIAVLRSFNKPPSKRPRSPSPKYDSDSSTEGETRENDTQNSKNGQATLLLSGITTDTMGIAALLPSKWTTLGELGLRSQISVASARIENAHIRQEIEFLTLLACASNSSDDKVRLLVWGRLTQVILKSHFPNSGTAMPEIWNASLAKVVSFDDLTLLKHVFRVIKAVQTHRLPAQKQSQSSVFPKPFRFKRPAAYHNNNNNNNQGPPFRPKQ